MPSQTQYAVIGLGRFGSSVAKQLMKHGYQVLGIDESEEIVDDLSEALTHTVAADATDEDVLRALGIRNFDVVVVAIGSDIQASILIAILCKDLGVKKVVAKAVTELHGRVLEKVGVDRIIYPERDMGIRVANQLATPNLLDYIELSDKYTIAELSVPSKLDGVTLKDLDPRARYGCSIVAINKTDGVIIAPTAADTLQERDVMVVIGTNEQIERFEHAVED
ncbi:potassium channel family protein [Paenibacillus turpanensis]|uniref:potassium channel family protein n=1 Tax=Paenibacillus turpanensis TaxID=2689078 RepID=UPI00140CA30A|nr:TrkA family potassium uptake protein [Paenibacillus turpanensis]